MRKLSLLGILLLLICGISAGLNTGTLIHIYGTMPGFPLINVFSNFDFYQDNPVKITVLKNGSIYFIKEMEYEGSISQGKKILHSRRYGSTGELEYHDILTYQYDDKGRLIAFTAKNTGTDPSTWRKTLEYDANQIIVKSEFGRSTWEDKYRYIYRYIYDDDGLLQTYQKKSPDSSTGEWETDSTNFYYYEGTKLVRVETDGLDTTIYLSYGDNETNIIWKNGGHSEDIEQNTIREQTTRKYDEAGRLVYEKSVYPSPTSEIEESIKTYEYDDEGRISKMTSKYSGPGFDLPSYYEELFEY